MSGSTPKAPPQNEIIDLLSRKVNGLVRHNCNQALITTHSTNPLLQIERSNKHIKFGKNAPPGSPPYLNKHDDKINEIKPCL